MSAAYMHPSRRDAAQEPDTALSDAGTEAEVESLEINGCGVAHVEGKAVFIEGALPGERVRLRYTRRRPRFDRALADEILRASPDRLAPPCPHFGVCGGCSLQHLRAHAQLAAKQQVLADALAHIGRTAPERWLPALSGPDYGYRRRARLGVRFVPSKGGVLVGFRERNRSFITPLTQCLTLDAEAAALLAPLRAVIARLSCPDRIPQVELSVGDNALAAVLRHLLPLNEEDLRLLAEFARAHGVQLYLQAGGAASLAPLVSADPEQLYYSLPEQNVKLAFGPTDFIQVNGAVNERMVSQALTLLDPRPEETVLDLFAGLGNFSLPIARRARRVLGIEFAPETVAQAAANAEANGIANARFLAADLYALADVDPPWRGESIDKVLLDPPRAGAMEALKALAAACPRRLVYVSCNPGTLARDAQYLTQALGYRFDAAGVIDMFPQTSHVEAMALFTRA